MSTTTAIFIGVALGLLLGAAITVWRRQYRDVFAVLLSLGIAALAVAVTIVQVGEYRDEKAAVAAAAAAPPPANPPDLPLALPRQQMMRGPTGATGAAAPPAVESPYAGGSR